MGGGGEKEREIETGGNIAEASRETVRKGEKKACVSESTGLPVCLSVCLCLRLRLRLC